MEVKPLYACQDTEQHIEDEVAVNNYRDTLHRHCCNHCYYGD